MVRKQPQDPGDKTEEKDGTGGGGLLESSLGLTATAASDSDGAATWGNATFAETLSWKQEFIKQSTGVTVDPYIPWSNQVHGNAKAVSARMDSMTEWATAGSSVLAPSGVSGSAGENDNYSESAHGEISFTIDPNDSNLATVLVTLTVDAEADAGFLTWSDGAIISTSTSAFADASVTIGQPSTQHAPFYPWQ